MEAKAAFARRFGISLADQVTARVETAARALHKLSPVAAPLMKYRPVHKLVAHWTGLAHQREMVVFDKRSLFERLPRFIPGKGPRVLYYAGCYAGYIRPALGLAGIAVMRHMGLQIHLPDQACCGLPQISKGMAAEGRRKAKQNLARWGELLTRVDHIVVTCSSCGYALMQDWSYLLPQPMAQAVRDKTVHISRLLNHYRQRLDLKPLDLRLAYHHPCHLRIQPDSDSSLMLMNGIPGVAAEDLKSHCCGIAGSWGMIAKNYPVSKAMAAPMIQRLNASGATYGVTDCPTCQMQMAHFGSLPVRHPVEIVAQSLFRGLTAEPAGSRPAP
jgi:Fe-S oxidoreductase